MKTDWLIILLFCLALLAFMIIKRKNFKFEGVKLKGIPILYIAAYQSTWGLGWVQRTAARHNRLIKVIGHICIAIGFIMMFVACLLLALGVYNAIHKPEVAKEQPSVMLVLPVQAKFTLYVPFIYWITVLFLVAFVHELGHALLAAAYGVPIKSAGFAVAGLILPIIPAAYVEPDTDELKRRSLKERLAVFSAGSAFNIILSAMAGVVYFIVLQVTGMQPTVLSRFFGWLFVLSLGIGATNLLPAGPLDGSQMIAAFEKKWLFVAVNVIALGLIFISILQSFVL